jgi:predicted amino acid racemase
MPATRPVRSQACLSARHHGLQLGLTLVETPAALAVSAVVAGTAISASAASLALRDLDGVAPSSRPTSP